MSRTLAVVLMLTAAGLLAVSPAGRVRAQDEFSTNSDAPMPDDGAVDVFATNTDDAATPMLDGYADTTDWEADPSVPDSSTGNPDQNAGPSTAAPEPYTPFPGTPRTPSAGAPAGRPMLQGRTTVYVSPKGDPYCCSGGGNECFLRMNAIIPDCAPPGNEQAAPVVHQIRAALDAFRANQDFPHSLAVQRAVERWGQVPMTPKAGAYVDCFEQLALAANQAEIIGQANANAANYAQIPDPAVRAQLQGAMDQVTAQNRTSFDAAWSAAGDCIDKADGVPARKPPLATATLKGHAGVTVGGSVTRGTDRLVLDIPVNATTGKPSLADNQIATFALKHKRGTSFTYKSATGYLRRDAGGAPFVVLTAVTDTAGRAFPVRHPHPIPVMLPATASPAAPGPVAPGSSPSGPGTPPAGVSPVLANAQKASQAAVDFTRGAVDGATWGITRALRDRLNGTAVQIVNGDAYDLGDKAQLAATTLIPLPGPSKARVAVSFAEFARSSTLTLEAARAVKAAAAKVWELAPTLRGQVIERAVAVLEYRPKGFDWIGVANKERFRQIDFVNYFTHEMVSLKTVYRTSEPSWASAANTLKNHLNDLADVTKQWKIASPGSVPSKMILDVRVPPGSEARLQSLIDYGRQVGVEVRIGTF